MDQSEYFVDGSMSMRHSDWHRYECKIRKVEESKLLLHWHGFGKQKDIWIERDSEDLGPLDLADVPPPAPTNSLKKVANATPSGSSGQQPLASPTAKDVENSSGCKSCVAPL